MFKKYSVKSTTSMMLRKNSYFLFLFALLATFNISAQTADVSQGCFPLTVKFTGAAGVNNPFWIFKDGGLSSTEINPSRIFTKAGIYDVELRQGSATGAIVGTVKISVYEKPVINLKTTNLKGCVPFEVPFEVDVKKDAAININAYQWTFGDGNSANATAPKHTYPIVGTYDVGVKITTNLAFCDVTQSFANIVTTQASPLVAFSGNPEDLTSCTAPFKAIFNNSSQPKDGVTFNWDFGNGIKFTGEKAPDQNYTKEGTYIVTLTGTNATGCKATATKVVRVGKPSAKFSFANDTLCINTNYKPNLTPADFNYQWNFGQGGFSADIALAQPSVRWGTSGKKTVFLTVTSEDKSCKDTASIVVYVEGDNAPFSSTFEGLDCQNPVNVKYQTTRPYQTYSWNFSTQDKQTSTATSPTISWKNTDPSGYSPFGKFLAFSEVKTISYAGCPASFKKVDTIHMVNARTVPDKWQGCVPLAVTFADSSYSRENITTYTYLWGDGSAPQTVTTNDPVIHTFTKAGEYKVRLLIKNTKGCIDTSHVVVIEVGDKVTPNFSADKTSVCINESVKITDLTNNPNIDTWHYSTDNGERSAHCAETPAFEWKYQNAGQQNVTLTVGYNGCYTSVTKNDYVTVKGPRAKIDYKVQCGTKNRDVVFNSSSQEVTALSWDFGDSTTSALNNLTHTYGRRGDFKVRLVATNSVSGCPASVDSVMVAIRDLDAKYEIVKKPIPSSNGADLCLGQAYDLKSKQSKDNHKTCFGGIIWSFPDDPSERPIITNLDSVEFTPKTPKIKKDYRVMLVVEDVNGCFDTLTKSFNVYGVYPKVTFQPKEFCLLPREINFDGTGSTSDAQAIKTWKWEFSPNGSSDKAGTASFKYEANVSGPQTIKLTLEDTAGCSGMITDTIKIYEPKSNVTSNSPTCLGEEVSLFATDFTEKGNKLTFEWFDGTKPIGTTQNIKYIPTVDGKAVPITLRIKETNTNCINTITTSVEVQTKPTVNFTLPAPACATNSTNSVSFTNTTDSKYNTRLYSWDFGNGKTADKANKADEGVTTYNKPGKYTIKLSAETTAGCKSSIQKEFSVGEAPKGTFTVSKNNICWNDAVTFTLKDTANVGSWEWDFDDGNTNKTSKSPVTHGYNLSKLLVAGTLTANSKLVLRDKTGGCAIDVIQAINISRVLADFKVLNDGICALRAIKFEDLSKGATSAIWDFGNGKTSTKVDSITYKVAGENLPKTTFDVKLIVQNNTNNCKDTIIRQVRVIAPEQGVAIRVPSIFAPEDAFKENQQFTYFSEKSNSTCIETKEVESITIFDRWGRKVFEEKVLDQAKPPKWNGELNGNGAAAAADVYLYVIRYKTGDVKTGDVTLMR